MGLSLDTINKTKRERDTGLARSHLHRICYSHLLRRMRNHNTPHSIKDKISLTMLGKVEAQQGTTQIGSQIIQLIRYEDSTKEVSRPICVQRESSPSDSVGMGNREKPMLNTPGIEVMRAVSEQLSSDSKA